MAYTRLILVQTVGLDAGAQGTSKNLVILAEAHKINKARRTFVIAARFRDPGEPTTQLPIIFIENS